jgi:hypothetical protein
MKPQTILMPFHTQKFFFYPHDTAFSNISYDSHKKQLLFV